MSEKNLGNYWKLLKNKSHGKIVKFLNDYKNKIISLRCTKMLSNFMRKDSVIVKKDFSQESSKKILEIIKLSNNVFISRGKSSVNVWKGIHQGSYLSYQCKKVLSFLPYENPTCLSKVNKNLWAYGSNGKISIMSSITFDLQKQLQGKSGNASSITILSGRLLASSYSDRTIKIWDFIKGTFFKNIPLSYLVSSIYMISQDTIGFISENKGAIDFIQFNESNTSIKNKTFRINGESELFSSLTRLNDNYFIVSTKNLSCSLFRVILFHSSNRTKSQTILIKTEVLSILKTGNKSFLICCKNGDIFKAKLFMNSHSTHLFYKLQNFPSSINSCSIFPCFKSSILILLFDNKISMVNLLSNEQKKTFYGHGEKIKGILMLSNNELLTYSDTNIFLWDVVQGNIIRSFDFESYLPNITSNLCIINSKTFATTHSYELVIWNTISKEFKQNKVDLSKHGSINFILKLTYSLLVLIKTMQSKSTIIVWDILNNNCLFSFFLEGSKIIDAIKLNSREVIILSVENIIYKVNLFVKENKKILKSDNSPWGEMIKLHRYRKGFLNLHYDSSFGEYYVEFVNVKNSNDKTWSNFDFYTIRLQDSPKSFKYMNTSDRLVVLDNSNYFSLTDLKRESSIKKFYPYDNCSIEDFCFVYGVIIYCQGSSLQIIDVSD